MEKSRQHKLLAIIALVLAITGMTLGFAAFSSTLNISSSASVNPNSSDFKIKIYGYSESTGNNIFNIDAYKSETLGYGFDNNTGQITNSSSINNVNLAITGIDIQMTQPTDDYIFIFKLANEGQYDAYFDLEQLSYNTPIFCNAESGTTESLVETACNSITQKVMVFTENTLEMISKYNNGEISEAEFSQFIGTNIYEPGKTGTIKLEKNKNILLVLETYYESNGNRADGPFTVTFEDIKLEFTTTPPNQE